MELSTLKGKWRETTEIPDDDAWGEIDNNSDIQNAYEYFFGKSREELVPFIENAPIMASEMIYFMPTRAFRFYIFCFDILVSEKAFESKLDYCDLAASMFAFCKLRILKDPNSILPLMDELLPVLHYVSEHQQEYGATISIYGKFSTKLDEIISLL